MDNPNEVTGKKIFFLHPTAFIQNNVITELWQQEYEAYTVKNHNQLARAIKKYPSSVVYINIDEGMPESDWENWITNLLKNFPDVKIGILSSNIDEELKEKFLNSLHPACGYLSLKTGTEKITAEILEALNNANAKGRRKYLRLSTERETNAAVNIHFKDDYVKGVINDVSVVGISCIFENDPEFAKNELVKDIQIKLQATLAKVEAVVFGSRVNNDKKIYVLLFTQRNDSDVRVKIRNYIRQNLQQRMNAEIG